MADFGTNATNLSAPQGAGANPLPTVTVGPLDNGVGQLLNGIVDIYAKGIGLQKKDEAEKLKTSVLGQYSQSQNMINNAFGSGQITAAEMANRSRALYSQHAASYPQFIEDLNKAASGFGQYSQLTEAQQAVKREEEMRKSALTSATALGYDVPFNGDRKAEDAALNAYRMGQEFDRKLKQQITINTETRAQNAEDQKAREARMKEMVGQGLVEIGGANIEFTRVFGENLINETLQNPEKYKDNVLRLQAQYGNIMAQINSLSVSHPELASNWKALFQDQMKLQMDMMDPKSNAEQNKAQLQLLQDKTKLAMLSSSPEFNRVVAASDLLGQNATVALAGSRLSAEIIANTINTPFGSGKPVQQAIGTEAEDQILKIAKNGASAVTQPGSVKDLEKLKLDTKNINENILAQVGSSLNGSAVPMASMRKVLSYVASPEFGKYVVENPLSQNAVNVAEKAWKGSYIPVVQKLIGTTLEDFLNESGGAGVSQRGQPARLMDTIDIVPTGAGVSIVPRKGVSLDAAQSEDQAKRISQISQSLNEMIRTGAHFQRSTDYTKYWEEHKSELLPQAYPVRKGGTVDYEGKKYVYLDKPGVAFYDRANWQPVNK